MKLAVYQYCDESQRHPHELSIRFAWCERAPETSELIAMGDTANWRVANVVTYEGDGLVTHVYAVSLYREELPEQEKWELYALRKLCPEQSLHVQLSDVGSEILGFEIVFSEQQPSIGSQLVRYGIREDTFVTRQEIWQVSEIDTLSAAGSNVPFQKISLIYHKVAKKDTKREKRYSEQKVKQ